MRTAEQTLKPYPVPSHHITLTWVHKHGEADHPADPHYTAGAGYVTNKSEWMCYLCHTPIVMVAT